MSDLPNELYQEILSYLPAEPLLRFRCVSKGWCSLIDDPGFIKLQLHRQKDDEQLILKNNWYDIQIYSLPLKSLNSLEESSRSIEATPFKIRTRLGAPRVWGLPLASCDGLVLFSHDKKEKIWALSNLFTREFLELPPVPGITRDINVEWLLCGLGYDVRTDDYKVVKLARFYKNGSSWLKTLVFCVKHDCWKQIDGIPNYSHQSGTFPSRRTGVFFQGALHWIIMQLGVEKQWILTFDLGTETYTVLPMPSGLQLNHAKHLDVLGGSLFISNFSYNEGQWDVHVWTMKDYGENGSWNKLFSLTNVGHWFSPISYWKNKGQVLIQYKNDFILLDVVKKSAKKLVQGILNNFCSQVLPATLVRLNYSGRAGKLDASKGTIGKKRKKDHDRLKLSLTATDFPLPLAE